MCGRFLWASAGNGIPPFCPHYGTWLHLNEKGREMSFNTGVRRKGRNKDAGECRCLCQCEISTQASWLLGASSTFTWTVVARKLSLLSSPKYTLSLPVAVLSSGDKQVSAIGVSNTHHSGNKIVPVNYLDSQTLAVRYFLWCFDRNTGIPRFIALHFFALHK